MLKFLTIWPWISRSLKCQGHISIIADKSSWPKQYCVHVWSKSIKKKKLWPMVGVVTIWPWMSRSLMGQGHISMWQTNALGLSNVVFTYLVNPLNNSEVMANVSIFDNLTLKVKVIKGSRSHIYVVEKSSWPKQHCV